LHTQVFVFHGNYQIYINKSTLIDVIVFNVTFYIASQKITQKKWILNQDQIFSWIWCKYYFCFNQIKT